VALGDLASARAATVVDARGLVVAPGFINMLSWAVDDLIVDGRSLGDIKQGVTPEVFGEGSSMGPLNEAMKRRRRAEQGDVIPLEEAIRRLTSLPAANLGLDRRGLLKPGYSADVVLFDPNEIADRATFELPHQFAAGVKHVFVNGVQVLKDGAHTGAKPGRAVWGPGKIN
jgi:N-acyl-D-aspartate/D-glutamate deacylase